MTLGRLPLAFVVLLVATASPGAGQDAGRRLPLVDESDLELASFEPRNVEAADLLARARALYGRRLIVAGDGRPDDEPVDNLFGLSGSVFVYETADRSKKILASLAAMDGQRSEVAQETRTYVPRHASLAALVEALAPFHRPGEPDGGPGVTASDLSGCLVLRDHPAILDEMMKVVRAVDVATEQVVVTCTITRPVASAPSGSHPLDAALEAALRRIDPHPTYEVLGVGAISLTAGAGRAVELEMDLDEAGTCRLSIDPGAYDPDRSVLTLESCEFRLQRIETQGFTTSCTLVAGRYEVVGVVGHEPVLVTLRMELRK